MLFTELGLKAEILRAIGEQGYDTPTPIQQQAIPAVMTGQDLMATAQTGTGKTAGFTLPILHRLASGPNTRSSKRPRVLVLVPTRELAIQVEESVRTYGKHLPINSLAVFGGVGINPQIASLRRGVDILVATPGRLLDHVQQRTVDLGAIEILVLDEADRMLDMGFIRDIRKIIALLPKQRQNLMFSATFSPDIRELAAGLLHQPVSVDVAPRNTAAETVTQRVIETNREQKKDLLLHLFETRSLNQVLIFTRTKHGADALSRHLEKAGIKSAALHGNKSQGARTRALDRVQGRQAGGAGRHRHRRARHRYRFAAPCHQLRDSQYRRRLRAPHRPYRPRRIGRRGALAGQPRRTRLHARHREADQAQSGAGGHPRFRAVRPRRPASGGAAARPAQAATAGQDPEPEFTPKTGWTATASQRRPPPLDKPLIGSRWGRRQAGCR